MYRFVTLLSVFLPLYWLNKLLTTLDDDDDDDDSVVDNPSFEEAQAAVHSN